MSAFKTYHQKHRITTTAQPRDSRGQNITYMLVLARSLWHVSALWKSPCSIRQPIFYVTTRVLQTNSTQQIKRLPDRLLSLRKPVRTRYRGARSPTTGNIWPYFHTNYFMHGPSLSSPETGNIKRFLPFNTVCTFPWSSSAGAGSGTFLRICLAINRVITQFLHEKLPVFEGVLTGRCLGWALGATRARAWPQYCKPRNFRPCRWLCDWINFCCLRW